LKKYLLLTTSIESTKYYSLPGYIKIHGIL